MDTDPKNTSEDAEMADCEGEKVVTMMDVLQEQEDFEEDVNAVLGASDDKNCTYSKGYIKRQAIYACMTCCSEAKDDLTKRAGVCLACSLTCHENHDLIELYTKRNFKCDCGNPKFNSHPCQFTPDKPDLNEENNYNQNFSGVYCVCQRPYPDTESTIDIEMIQCVVCEDWLHATHLEATVPDNDQYSEMICKGCMEKNDFLHDYSNLAVNVDVDVVTNGIDNDNKICNGDANPETVEDETIKATNADMKEKDPDNIKFNPEENTSKTNEENMCDTKDSTNEEKDNGQAEDSPMQKDCTKTTTLAATEQTNPDENNSPHVSKDNIVEETITDICMISGNTVKDLKNQNESSVEQAQQLEHKEPQNDSKETESGTEPENPISIEKSAEQIEEERLLAEPDDEKLNLVEMDHNQKSTNTDNTANEGNKTKQTNEIENAKVDSEDKQNKTSNIKSSTETVSEIQVEEKCVEYLKKDEAAHILEIKENGTDTKEAFINKSPNGEMEVQSIKKNTEKRKVSTEENSNTDSKKAKLDELCVRPKGIKNVLKGATFWPSTFRQKLCTCRECITMYKDLSVLFLIDPEDTVTAYENLGKQKIDGKPASQYEKGLQALSSLDRVQQINALTEYNKMRDKLLDFLNGFKVRREVVKEEDIRTFFAGMKPKREPDGVYFCR